MKIDAAIPGSVTTAVVIVAAGRGLRAQGDAAMAVPKQYRALSGVPMLARTLAAFTSHSRIDQILMVIGPEDTAHFETLGLDDPRVTTCIGGADRQQSVRNGLECLAAGDAQPERVLIHDAARPFVTAHLIDAVIDALDTSPAVLPLLPVTDTVKRVNTEGHVIATLERAALGAAQTPQGFVFTDILDAHRRAGTEDVTGFTDDASIAEWAGLAVGSVAGHSGNFKVTTPEDIARAEWLLGGGNSMQTRIGQGFDVHRFVPGDHVVLGGVCIPHDKALSGHSDADVLLHAITDAILGALADGDIGSHFPPGDPQWKAADSALFLEHAVRRVAERSGSILHLDATVMCEMPKIGPVRDTIRQRIADITGLPVGRIAVKATTTEQLGFTGRREGIAALAVATLELPTQE